MTTALAFAIAAFALTVEQGPSYTDHRAAAVKQCEAIDPSQYQSGLYFNPDGYRSYYVRSECFQRAAVRFRDDSLCGQVKQRRALLSSSWGYSGKNCRALVSAALAKDRTELAEIRRAYLAAHMTLTDVRIELNNNGRDFDILPIVTGTTGHGYTLRFEVMPESGGTPALLHADGYYVDTSPLRIYVTRADVRQRVPDLSPDRRYTVTATMTFSLPTGSGDAEWSDAFVESAFPRRQRTQTVTRTMTFPAPTMSR